MTERTTSLRHRHQLEVIKLTSAWNTIAISHLHSLIVNIAGVVKTASGNIRDFRIDVPNGYPYRPPRVYAIGWNPGALHTYPHSELCLWRPEQWTPRYTLAYTVAKAFTWIHKHDVYMHTNRWPGRGQTH